MAPSAHHLPYAVWKSTPDVLYMGLIATETWSFLTVPFSTHFLSLTMLNLPAKICPHSSKMCRNSGASCTRKMPFCLEIVRISCSFAFSLHLSEESCAGEMLFCMGVITMLCSLAFVKQFATPLLAGESLLSVICLIHQILFPGYAPPYAVTLREAWKFSTESSGLFF